MSGVMFGLPASYRHVVLQAQAMSKVVEEDLTDSDPGEQAVRDQNIAALREHLIALGVDSLVTRQAFLVGASFVYNALMLTRSLLDPETTGLDSPQAAIVALDTARKIARVPDSAGVV